MFDCVLTKTCAEVKFLPWATGWVRVGRLQLQLPLLDLYVKLVLVIGHMTQNDENL